MDYITQIKMLQVLKGVNSTQTAERMNISKQNFSKKIKNRTFSVDDLESLADVLGFDMEIIFTDRENGKKI